MARVELHAELLLDDLAHPPARPESRRKPEPFRSRLHNRLHPRQLSPRQPRLAAGTPRLAQTRPPRLLQSPRPAIDRLPVHAHLA
jgi:hypothetical protein